MADLRKRAGIEEEDKLTATFVAARDYILRHTTRLLAIAVAIVLIVAVSSLVARSRTRARDQVQAQLSEALMMSQTMNHERGALMLESLMEKHPGGALGEDIMYHCATAQFLSGNHQRALELFQKLEQKHLRDPLHRFAVRDGIGNCYEAQSEFGRAAEHYERLAEDAPDEIRIPGMLAQSARCYELAADYASSERLGRRIVEEFGDDDQWRREGERLVARAKVLGRTEP
ncbi:MAG: hypothetical protein KAW17_10140 [Candidatus Eisenbacteria sp.]|nr:hypothetical protein [Candidatus Eisenbacteria bacterium]